MKLNIKIFIILFLILNIFNNNQLVIKGEFQPDDSEPSEFPFEDILGYFPVYAIYNAFVPDSWKLTNSDYQIIVKTAICSIPVVGTVLDSLFSIFWGKLYPEESVSLDEFKYRMTKLANDMRFYTRPFVKTSEIEFGNVRQVATNYKSMIEIWNHQINTTGVANSQLKDNLPVIYWIFLTKLEDSLLTFSDPEDIHRIGKVFLETTFYYISLLRDGHFNGVQMGLSSEMITGISNRPIETFADKLNDKTIWSINNIGLIFSKLIIEQHSECKDDYNYSIILGQIEAMKENEKEIQIFDDLNFDMDNTESMVADDCYSILKKLPNWSLLTSRILYSNLYIYDSKILFLKGRDYANDEELLNSNLTIEINITDSINIIDFRTMGKKIETGFINKNPYEQISQVCDFVTGMVGFDYSIGKFLSVRLQTIIEKQYEPHFFNYENGMFVKQNGSEPPQPNDLNSYFFVNIILNEFTNKFVKFRIYATDGSFLTDYSLFKLKIGGLKSDQTELTYDPLFLDEDSNDNFKTFVYIHSNDTESYKKEIDFSTVVNPFKIVSENHGPFVRPRVYMETPFLNFDDCTRAYFELIPIPPFSLNLLSLEIITSSTPPPTPTN